MLRRTRKTELAASRSTGPRFTRRALLGRSLAAASVLAAPYIVPAAVLGRAGRAAPSERILLGGIGLGGRGRAVLSEMLAEPDVQFLAICDINPSRREMVKNLVDTTYGNTDCAMSANMRRPISAPTAASSA